MNPVTDTVATHSESCSSLEALDTLQKFLEYSDKLGDKLLSYIDMSSDNPELAKISEWAEVTLLCKVNKVWVVYLKIFGNDKGSYAFVPQSYVYRKLALDALHDKFCADMHIIVRAVNSIMDHTPSS